MAYEQMGFLYDPFMKDAPYDKWLAFTQEMIDKSGKNIKSIADLGCGTGEITIKLAKKGYQLFGVDYSIDMLTYADQKSRADNIPIQWIHQDLRELEGLTNLDAVISYCDVMNYITSESDLKNVFERVAQSLKVGGLFMFDIHSLHYVINHLVNNSFTEVTDEMAYIWECVEGDHQGEMYHELTFFILEDEKYSRIDEFHHQRTFPIEVFERILIAAGFKKPVLYSDFSLETGDLNEKSERIFIVTEKRSG
jgi:SAM-dependent methyltransferase